jgi:hypothetical protein
MVARGHYVQTSPDRRSAPWSRKGRELWAPRTVALASHASAIRAIVRSASCGHNPPTATNLRPWGLTRSSVLHMAALDGESERLIDHVCCHRRVVLGATGPGVLAPLEFEGGMSRRSPPPPREVSVEDARVRVPSAAPRTLSRSPPGAHARAHVGEGLRSMGRRRAASRGSWRRGGLRGQGKLARACERPLSQL